MRVIAWSIWPLIKSPAHCYVLTPNCHFPRFGPHLMPTHTFNAHSYALPPPHSAYTSCNDFGKCNNLLPARCYVPTPNCHCTLNAPHRCAAGPTHNCCCPLNVYYMRKWLWFEIQFSDSGLRRSPVPARCCAAGPTALIVRLYEPSGCRWGWANVLNVLTFVLSWMSCKLSCLRADMCYAIQLTGYY